MKHNQHNQRNLANDFEDIQLSPDPKTNDKDPEIEDEDEAGSTLKRTESTIAMIANELCGKRKNTEQNNETLEEIMHVERAFCIGDDIDLTEDFEGDTMTTQSTVSRDLDIDLHYPSDITTSIDIDLEIEGNDTHETIDAHRMSL